MSGDRVRARANCQHCSWTAEHTGDDGLEVGVFLRKLLIRHVVERHTDKVTAEILDAYHKATTANSDIQ